MVNLDFGIISFLSETNLVTFETHRYEILWKYDIFKFSCYEQLPPYILDLKLFDPRV